MAGVAVGAGVGVAVGVGVGAGAGVGAGEGVASDGGAAVAPGGSSVAAVEARSASFVAAGCSPASLLSSVIVASSSSILWASLPSGSRHAKTETRTAASEAAKHTRTLVRMISPLSQPLYSRRESTIEPRAFNLCSRRLSTRFLGADCFLRRRFFSVWLPGSEFAAEPWETNPS